MGKLLQEIIKALIKRGGKATPKKPPKATKPSCKSNCGKLLKNIKAPARRHNPCKTRGKDPTKDKNSMLDPDINVGDDLKAIKAGKFEQFGDDILVNGRTYGQHSDTGRLFPKSGPGIHQFDRGQHQLLKQLNSQPFDKAMKFAEKFPGLDKEKIGKVLELWRKCK